MHCGKWGNKVKNKIICTSKTIFDNASNAHPDNAFDYVICNNVFEFLICGLGLDFGDLQYSAEDTTYWEQLASNIDISTFYFLKHIFIRNSTHLLLIMK